MNMGTNKVSCMDKDLNKCMDRVGNMYMGNNLSMSNKDNYSLNANSLIMHLMMQFYFFLILIMLIMLRFKLFLIFFLILLVFVIMLAIYYLIIVFDLIIQFDLIIFYLIKLNVFYSRVILFILPIDHLILVFFSPFLIQLLLSVFLFIRFPFFYFLSYCLQTILYVDSLNQSLFFLVKSSHVLSLKICQSIYRFLGVIRFLSHLVSFHTF